MATILTCLIIGVLLPYLLAFASLPFRSKQFDGDVGLDHPRAQANLLTDAGARVRDAQANAWEALTVFAVACLAASMAGVSPDGSWSMAAMVWVVARVLHGVAYSAGWTVLRVAGFAAAVSMSAWIMVMALRSLP